jgi:dTDP-glucose pyrophosphorylase
MWGIIPSAGVGSRIQPLGFSKELLPVGSRASASGGGSGAGPSTQERPRALGDYIASRMALAGVTRFCFVIAPGKTELLAYYGADVAGRPAAYVVQDAPLGLCDAIFRALPLIRPEEQVVVGLPDTIWFPEHGLKLLPDGGLSLLCFPTSRPERYEAVLAGEDGEVREIRVARDDPGSRWIWGAFKLDGATLSALFDVWCERGQVDENVGDLVNAWLARGGTARAVKAGEAYVDVDTAADYREALGLLREAAPSP